ncbi:MAG: tetratricopeptide repeat protein [Rhodospirillaceae bacterium]|nr:MAG: tetratricopeptide repeat protein [Rhodospirillaceae bacterium]
MMTRSVGGLLTAANQLAEQGRLEEALASYDHALELDPNSAVTVNSRGVTLIALERIEDALADFRRAFTLDPTYVEAYLNAAAALRDSGRFVGALQLANRAIALCPDSGTAWHIRAVALDWLGRDADAIDAYGKAVSFDDTIELAAGRGTFLAMYLCRWDSLATDVEKLLARVNAGHLAAAPFYLLTLPSSPAQQRAASELYSNMRFGNEVTIPLPPRQRSQKIRIGYFSPDFRTHPTSHLIAGLIEAHDRVDFEIFGFKFGSGASDTMTQRLERAFDKFIDIGALSIADAVSMVREQNIDIAVDLAGHTSKARPRLFTCRMAPIQVNYLGFPGTLGMEAIDYMIADEIVIPAEHRQYYTEKIVSLPCYQVNDSKRPHPEGAVSRRGLGLPENAFVFCGFNSAFKLTPREFDIWMRLLKNVNGSVLWLLDRAVEVAFNWQKEEVRLNLQKEAERRGISPDRLVFAPRVEVSEHLARHQAADLFLDTLTCNAHTTASDALWMGLPIITMLGDAFPGRVAASLLTAAGLPELVTRSEAEYESLALDLATHPHKLARLKQHLRQHRKSCTLFDTALFATNIETAYRKMVAIYDTGSPPEHFSI